MLRDKLLAVSILIVFLSPTMLQADTIPGGDVSGVWYAANSPYYIIGNITVPYGDTLTIEPNVDVIFLGYYRLHVSGRLEADGTAADSILFVPSDTSTGWRGLYYATGGSHQLSYCDIEYAHESGIQMRIPGLTLQVSHCTIAHCRHTRGGGILVSDHGNLVITNSTIAYNTAESDTGGKGGGIYLHYNTLVMDSCTVHGNRAVIPTPDYEYFIGGGGIFIQSMAGSAAITNSIITDNFTGLSNGGCHSCTDPEGEGGGGISSYLSNVTISNCLIRGNYANVAEGGGGGIYINASTFGRAVVSGCDISYNSAGPVYGGNGMGLYAYYGLDIIRCTFFGNNSPYTPREAITLHSGTTNIGNSIVAYNQKGIVNYYGTVTCRCSAILDTGNVNMPVGFGVLDTVNHNGDSCDVFFNIFMNPMFVDTANGDLRLIATSPCIDAGDPASPYDPDSTIADMGCYYYDHRLPHVELSDLLLDFDMVIVGKQSSLPLTIYNVGTIDTLVLYDISCGLAVFSTDFDPADSLILPGDSLQITVSFSPSDTSTVFDTLRITNNDHICEVKLMGKGKTSDWVDEDISAERPKDYALRPAYPNPFNPVTTIGFDLPKPSEVTLKIYNILGQEVGTFALGRLSAGKYKYVWQADGLASGVYFYRIEAGEFVQTKKMVMMK